MMNHTWRDSMPAATLSACPLGRPFSHRGRMRRMSSSRLRWPTRIIPAVLTRSRAILMSPTTVAGMVADARHAFQELPAAGRVERLWPWPFGSGSSPSVTHVLRRRDVCRGRPERRRPGDPADAAATLATCRDRPRLMRAATAEQGLRMGRLRRHGADEADVARSRTQSSLPHPPAPRSRSLPRPLSHQRATHPLWEAVTVHLSCSGRWGWLTEQWLGVALGSGSSAERCGRPTPRASSAAALAELGLLQQR